MTKPIKKSDQMAEAEFTKAVGRTTEQRKKDMDAAIEENIRRWKEPQR